MNSHDPINLTESYFNTALKRQGLVNPKNWMEMDGNTDLERHLNGYLAQQYFKDPVKPDQCLTEAQEIIEIVHVYEGMSLAWVKYLIWLMLGITFGAIYTRLGF